MKKGARGETLLPSVPLPRAAAPEAPAASTGARADGRGAEEFRPVFFNTKVVSQATGSAYAEFDRTKVMVAVYGPRQSERKFGFVDTGRVNVEVSITRFASQARERQALLSEQRAFQDTLQRAIEGSVLLHRFPKAVVDVYVCILESGGGDLAAAIAAASLALCDAGIELYDLVPACSVALTRGPNGTLLLDPTAEEAASAAGVLTLAMMPAANELTQLHVTGGWGLGLIRQATELAMGGCAELKAAMRACALDAAAAGAGAMQ